jgi:alpha,alpha-trehalase
VKFEAGRNAWRRSGVLILISATISCYAQVATPRKVPILDYITQTWHTLTRTNRDLASAAVDPKYPPLSDGRWPVYVPRQADIREIEESLEHEMAPSDKQKIELRPLPPNPVTIREQGLLYLPKPYVVPGGRFNEMYGWDSYFIQVGLLRDGEIGLAKDMADNFLYEIRNYGKVLNANRTYYLTRSQPPFLTQMVLGVFQKTRDRRWLREALPAIEKYYRFWTTEPHLVRQTGLSRYFDTGDGPAPEVLASERDPQGRTHYDLARAYYRTHEISDYDVSEYYNRRTDQLTALFYKGDRSMRESGFDPSNRFGPFSVDIIHYNPVCLNSLLYLMEMQTAEIAGLLRLEAEAQIWRGRAIARAERINKLLWDSEDGLYYDYDFEHKRLRKYAFLTTFCPLWAGIATREQAARVAANLPIFEQPGGLQTSTIASGSQWDAPFGWAPLQMIAVQGIRRYGFSEAADRIAMKFLSLVRDEYLKTGTIVEKYDVVHRSAEISGDIRFGYRSNEAGFGWTNAVFTALLDELGSDSGREILNGGHATRETRDAASIAMTLR